MLIRELVLKPWEESPLGWEYAVIELGSGRSLGVFRAAKTNQYRPHRTWLIYYNHTASHTRAGIGREHHRTDHNNLEEFEAQMVLDHYLQNKSTVKPSGDT